MDVDIPLSVLASEVTDHFARTTSGRGLYKRLRCKFRLNEGEAQKLYQTITPAVRAAQSMAIQAAEPYQVRQAFITTLKKDDSDVAEALDSLGLSAFLMVDHYAASHAYRISPISPNPLSPSDAALALSYLEQIALAAPIELPVPTTDFAKWICEKGCHLILSPLLKTCIRCLVTGEPEEIDAMPAPEAPVPADEQAEEFRARLGDLISLIQPAFLPFMECLPKDDFTQPLGTFSIDHQEGCVEFSPKFLLSVPDALLAARLLCLPADAPLGNDEDTIFSRWANGLTAEQREWIKGQPVWFGSLLSSLLYGRPIRLSSLAMPGVFIGEEPKKATDVMADELRQSFESLFLAVQR
jgi:hypothetical protein